jgi:hypothetical protein
MRDQMTSELADSANAHWQQRLVSRRPRAADLFCCAGGAGMGINPAYCAIAEARLSQDVLQLETCAMRPNAEL